MSHVPPGRRLYAIGDVHGRLDLLDMLIEMIDEDSRSRGGPIAELIFLGDIIDRGPQSAQTIDRLIALAANRPGTRFLLGNHEEVFLTALKGDIQALRLFTRIGGDATILSYGVDPQLYKRVLFKELLGILVAAVPQSHISFLERFEDMIVAGDYAFVHAGVRASRPLHEQRPADLRWIREEFLTHRDPYEKIIVHGHSVVNEVEIHPNRIGIDTGAFATGRLTAMGFEGGQRWIVQTRPDSKAA